MTLLQMEILNKNQYAEYEDFAKNYPLGVITQSIKWHQVKSNWENEVVVVRENGKIIAGISILIRSVPIFGSMMYAPRGPLMDFQSPEIFAKLKKGIDILARKHRAYLLKIDPELLDNQSEAFKKEMKDLGFTHFAGETGFEHIQTRFNYRVYLENRTEEQLLMDFHSKTRYNIRLAGRRGVTVKSTGKDGLDDFMELMRITGERDGFTVRSKSYFENMLDALGEDIRLYIAYYEGIAIAGGIASSYGGRTSYIYGASHNDHRNVMAPHLIQWEMIKWAVETNSTVYDMMGVSGDTDPEDNPLYGLYRFKDGFTGQLDELVGDFDYEYKPFVNKLANWGIATVEKLREVRRKA